MTALFALIAALAMQSADDGPVRTGANMTEAADALRLREAIAYSNPMPPGAPTQDYQLVAWCEALVNGHVALGETLSAPDDMDREIMSLARLEAADFRDALRSAQARQTPAVQAAATEAAALATAKWTPLMAHEDETVRSQSFGLFFGLPGRCEHAARRIRDNITAPPATLAEVGLEAAAPESAGTSGEVSPEG